MRRFSPSTERSRPGSSKACASLLTRCKKNGQDNRYLEIRFVRDAPILEQHGVDVRTKTGMKIRGESLRYTKYERTGMVGARALQIAMGAPLLMDIPHDMTDPIEIALLEFEKEATPLTIIRDKKRSKGF